MRFSLLHEDLGALREADDPAPTSLAHFHLAFELHPGRQDGSGDSGPRWRAALSTGGRTAAADSGRRPSFYRERPDT